jgi:hypothetical protein
MRDRTGILRAAALVAPLLAVPLAAQETRGEMVVECRNAGAVVADSCLEALLALEALRGGIGLATTQGSPVPGSSSTLGRRLGSSPRIAMSLRGSLTRVHMPDARTGQSPSPDLGLTVPAIEGGLALGVLDGVSLLPTVGGFFSLDLIASVGAAALSDDDGFDESVQWFGYGARLGLLRESFTLPGVSASLARRHLTNVGWGDTEDDAAVAADATVMSFRATVGKDFLAFGILGGWGWERYGGESTIAVRSANPLQPARADSDDYSSDRTLFFGGLSYTFLVLQLAAEGGFATGWSDVPSQTDYDPTAGTIFGSLSGRLTF